MQQKIQDATTHIQQLCEAREQKVTAVKSANVENPIVILTAQLPFERSVIAQAMIDIAQHNIRAVYFKQKGNKPERFICFTSTDTPCTKQLAEDLRTFVGGNQSHRKHL